MKQFGSGRMVLWLVGVLVPLMLSGCMAMHEARRDRQQQDMDIIRVQHLQQIGSWLEEYRRVAGHYPLGNKKAGQLASYVYIDRTNQRANHVNGVTRYSIVMSTELFEQDLSQVLGRPIRLPVDPQSSYSDKPLSYIYIADGDSYRLVGFTDHAFLFTKPLAEHSHLVSITSDARLHDGINYWDLMGKAPFKRVLAATPAKPELATDPQVSFRKAGGFSPATGQDKVLYALHQRRLNDVKALLQTGGINLSPNCLKRELCNALTFEAQFGTAEGVAMLLDAGANVAGVDGYHDSALMAAVSNADPVERAAIFDLLLAAKADPNVPNIYGWLPLAAVAQEGEIPLMERLVDHGAHLNFSPKVTLGQGPSPLVAAVKGKQLEAVKWLLAKGVRTNMQDDREMRPLDYAKEGGDAAIIKLLEESLGKPEPQIPSSPQGL